MVLADSCFNLTHDSFDHDLYDVIKEAQNEGMLNMKISQICVKNMILKKI